MRCPSCGMNIDADKRYAKLVVCAACNSSVVLDEKAVRLSGKMAILAETPSPLYLNATGKLAGKPFTVLGRVRYGYARGYWDEWYLELDDGRTAWISEDEGNLTIEICETLEGPPVEYASVQPGDTITIKGNEYHVDEKDVARCEGGAGQLPFVIEQDERVPFLDLSAAGRFATLEYELEESIVRFFQGKRIEPEHLEIDYPREAVGGVVAPTAERAGDEGARERVVRRTDRAKSLNCNCCGAPLVIPADGGKSVSCEHCGTEVKITARSEQCTACKATIPVYGYLAAKSLVCPKCRKQLDITGKEPSLLAAVVQPNRPKVPFRIGHRGKLRGMNVVIVGHLRFLERDEGKSYYSDEFLLHCDKVGYRWLVMENGHFSLTEELADRPSRVSAAHITPGERFTFQGSRYRVFERGKCEIVWVDGELPWVAKVGDKNRYMDATAPPFLLSAEWTESEQEWYRAQYLERDEVIEGLGIRNADLPKKSGVAAHQQFMRSAFRKQATVIMGVCALISGALAVHSFFVSGKQVGNFTLNSADYAEEFVTREFTTTDSEVLCAAKFEAPLNNSWVYLDVAVLNDRDEALLDFSAEMSYYSGVEGGERWSEGSNRDSKVFKLNEPGTYRFLVLGQAGTGETAGNTARSGPPVTITVFEGAILSRYYLLFSIACLLWLVTELAIEGSFEKRKWSQSDVEND